MLLLGDRMFEQIVSDARLEARKKKNEAGANNPKNLWGYFNRLKPKQFVSDAQNRASP
ncbi:hypothetical protein DY000_02055515 [Brassica cretica]|uniref:Uncharacterized protein n=1 Tax=Brassica cretica TaxID=69181 RepID=A0ABQ7A5V0_BRACR|nr:hypothetical protein DY000_02055515 [Brassica cretica]